MSYKTTLTVCPYCGTGCGIYLEVIDGQVIRTIPCKDHPINQGTLCIKGWNAHEFIHHPERLRTPLLKKGKHFVEASWEEALEYIAKSFKKIREKYGSDSFGGFSSAKCTNEENFLFMKFMRAVLGTNNIDHCARL